MIFLLSFTPPFSDPVMVFGLLLAILLFVPILFKKIKVPGIIGIILAGILVGPYGLNWIERDERMILLGTIGLIYIMFLAGLELDMNDFTKNKNRSITFGALTFLIPLSLGTLVCFYVLDYSLMASILIASMFATHTLVAYPIASRLGLAKNEAVNITVGGTIITDTAVLVILAIVAGSHQGEVDLWFFVKMAISLLLFVAGVIFIFPRVGRWFFKNVRGESSTQFVFVLFMVFVAAFAAELAGFEAIIGAFLAGLVLNRLIPHSSALMNRIEFFGNTLFIPFFLISTGMLIDLKLLMSGPKALTVAGVLIMMALLAKYLAAYGTQKIFSYSKDQRNLIFGLSSAHAAATIAVILVGYKIGLLDENVLNGTILLILVTCLVGSFVTERAGKKLAISEREKKPDLNLLKQRILVPIANPATIDSMMELALAIKDHNSADAIFPLSIVEDGFLAQEKVLEGKMKLAKAEEFGAAHDLRVEVLAKVDMNVSSGVIRAIKEMLITEVLIGWSPKVRTTDKLFGSTMDHIIDHTYQMIIVNRILHPINTMKNIRVILPPNAEHEKGFNRWALTLIRLAEQTSSEIHFYGGSPTFTGLKIVYENLQSSVKLRFHIINHFGDFKLVSKDMHTMDLLVILCARSRTVSYHSAMQDIPTHLVKHFKDYSFLLIYPEQYPYTEESANYAFDSPFHSPFYDNLNRIQRLGRGLGKIFKKGKE